MMALIGYMLCLLSGACKMPTSLRSLYSNTIPSWLMDYPPNDGPTTNPSHLTIKTKPPSTNIYAS